MDMDMDRYGYERRLPRLTAIYIITSSGFVHGDEKTQESLLLSLDWRKPHTFCYCSKKINRLQVHNES